MNKYEEVIAALPAAIALHKMNQPDYDDSVTTEEEVVTMAMILANEVHRQVDRWYEERDKE